jgi:hypothetical protein
MNVDEDPGAGPVSWNDDMAAFAQNASNTCVFKHT